MKITKRISSRGAAAFMLIEMIGILAIMTILAGIMTPNILQSIERAAVRAEAENLRSLSSAIGLYMRDNNGVLPTEGVGNWNTQLAPYSSLGAADIYTNKRQMARLYVRDPANASNLLNQRALIISSMRTGVNLPPIANVRTNFQGIWNAAENTVPPGTWTGWGAGPLPALDNIEYLVIERVSLASVYRNEFQTYNIILNHHGAVTVSYKITYAIGGSLGPINMVVGTLPVTLSLKSKDRLDLYSNGGGVTLNFSYVVSSTPKSFDFTTTWTAL